jgi:hypothetical protein
MFERLFTKKAKIEQRRREMVLEVYERRFGQELLNLRLEKFLAAQRESDEGKFRQGGRSFPTFQVRPDHA